MEVLNRQLDPECAVQTHLSYMPLFFPELDLSP